jgi:hypothetical protein
VEEGLYFQFVHPATQGTSESSLTPKVEMAEPLSQEIQKFGASSD